MYNCPFPDTIQALDMMREEKLFSGIYSAGTALAILFTLAGKRLCTVLIGTAIPALKIVKNRITEALRDE